MADETTNGTTITPPCLLDMSAEEYHQDPLPRPSLSASIAHVLVSKSPLHAWLKHPRLGGAKHEPTKEMERGTVVHSMLLGGGLDLEVIEADDYRTKAAQAARDAAREAGKIPMLAREVDSINAMLTCIRQQFNWLGIHLTGQSEVSAVWEEDSSLGPVLCRGRMDHLIVEQGLIIDLKTARSANPRDLPRHCYEFGYDVQWAAYTNALQAIHPEFAGRVEMLFIFVESEYPHCVTPVRLDGSMRHLGMARWERAIEAWAACLGAGVERKHWPGYADGVVSIEAPQWALYQEELVETTRPPREQPCADFTAAMEAFAP